MIWTILLFLMILGPLYAWGLIKYFRHNFRWDLASVVGILTVVSITLLSNHWRGQNDIYIFYLELTVNFLFALPSMMKVAKVLGNDKKLLKRQLKFAQTNIISLVSKLDAQKIERREMLSEVERIVGNQKFNEQEMFFETLKVIYNFQKQAEEIINSRNN